MDPDRRSDRGGGYRERRRRKESPVPNSGNVAAAGSLGPMFDGFRRKLDAQHDKYERLVKISRDLTTCSKRAIFTLQRANLSSRESRIRALAEADEQLDSARNKLIRTLLEELRDAEPRKYANAFSPGVQEYVEAQTLRHFIASGTLMNSEQLESQLEFSGESGRCAFDLWPVDYLLGVADLSGELMRLAINSAASGDCKAPFYLMDLVRDLERAFAEIDVRSVPGRGLGSKRRVLRSTLNKMEAACHTITLRGSEVPSHMMNDLFSTPDESRDVFD